MFSHIEEPKRVVGAPWVRRLKKKQRAVLKIVGVKPEWIVTHWMESKGTQPCLAKRTPDAVVVDEQDCHGCRNNDPIRARGYLYCWNYDTSRNEFLELTVVKWDEIKCAANGITDLRGYKLTIWRGQTDNARLQFSLEPADPTTWGEKFPHAPCIDPSIKVLMKK